MYKIIWKQEFPLFILIAIMMGVYLFFYDKLPDVIPIHWNINGDVDNSVIKNIFSVLMPTLVTLGVYLLMLFFPYIDPKKERYEKFGHAYTIMRITIVLFMLIMSVTVLMNMLGKNWPVQKIIPAMVGVLFLVFGNYMGKIKSNWMVGIKLPWTLANEEVWNKTHRLGGKIMVGTGILTLFSLVYSPLVTFITLMTGIVVMTISVVVYSIVLFEKIKKRNNYSED